MEWTKGPYRISDGKDELDLFYVVSALEDSYWAVGREQSVVEESIRNSVAWVCLPRAGRSVLPAPSPTSAPSPGSAA